MFLNTFNAGVSFDFARDPGMSFGKPAIEAELGYLDGVDCSDIRVEETGSFIVLDGSVSSSSALSRVTRVASEIVGRENVICHLIVIPRTKAAQTVPA